jgi:hypothetical protein
MVMKIAIVSIIGIVYIIYTIRYLILFNQKGYFAGRLKMFHILMMWLIPFIWIILLKNLFKPTPGSYHFIDKKDPDTLTECGLGIWIDNSTGT